ncbi:MAG: DUF4920 domain-containing protein [Chitinophagaceae bacterium]|nr:DUF4920 domain-containing protein [Chitinophagaceae bacterium]
MKKILFSIAAFFLFGVVSAQPPAGDANIGDFYGSKIKEGKSVSAKSLMNNLKKAENNTVESTLIEGKVLEVCPNKGCWIKVELANKEVATVKMKGYSFFVPLALEGKKVKIDGKAEIATTSVDELKHLAEDAQKSQAEIDAITQPKKELKILANGIEVVK